MHRRDCWQAKGGWRSQRITEAQAAALVREHGPERICDVCRPDRHLPSSGASAAPVGVKGP